MKRPHVVIVGAGFGGVYTAQALLPYVKHGEIDITIINRTNYFLFTPLLHEVATGGMSPTSIAEPLHEIFSGTNVKVLETDVRSIDTTEHVVQTGQGPLHYDYLVVSAGAETNYYNIPGAREHTFVLKNLLDAVNIRDGIVNAFEKAARATDAEERARLLSFVVVGGGATGVELAAEISEFVYDTLAVFYRQKGVLCNGVSVTLVSSDPELVKQFRPELRAIAHKTLVRKKVNVKLEAVVSEVQQDKIIFKDGSSIPTALTVWVAGVKPSHIDITGMERHPSERLMVDEYLRAIHNGAPLEHIFVSGDMAASLPRVLQQSATSAYIHGATGQQRPQPLPMLAQVAEEQAKVLARNIIATVRARGHHGEKLQPFRYSSKGTLFSLGQWYAAGEIYGVPIHGRMAWWIWRTVYLFKFHSWRRRFKIATEWTINLFYSRDITKLR